MKKKLSCAAYIREQIASGQGDNTIIRGIKTKYPEYNTDPVAAIKYYRGKSDDSGTKKTVAKDQKSKMYKLFFKTDGSGDTFTGVWFVAPPDFAKAYIDHEQKETGLKHFMEEDSERHLNGLDEHDTTRINLNGSVKQIHSYIDPYVSH